ncbi:MAG: 4Fe-4S dicluster domain-containing protein [Chloroflexi bacterium]|nr:4Fe-4S dicluster domain-containing protein [Chloroflexota bacterium]
MAGHIVRAKFTRFSFCCSPFGSAAIKGTFACTIDGIGNHFIDQDICTQCGVCYTVCPKKVNAVEIISPSLKV